MRLFYFVGLILLVSGCDGLGIRIEPSELQKQNAWSHMTMSKEAATLAKQELTSETLQNTTSLCAEQSEAFAAYYGMPREPVEVNVKDEKSYTQAINRSEVARLESIKANEPWKLAEGMLDAGIAIAGLIGGVYGVQAGKFLKRTKDNSLALKEIVMGNENFKTQNMAMSEEFKRNQNNQSNSTRKIVQEIKIEN